MGMERKPGACGAVPGSDRQAMPSADLDTIVDADRANDSAGNAISQNSDFDHR